MSETSASGTSPAATKPMQISHGSRPSMPVKGRIVGPTANVTDSMEV
jgi:hypothetical protein